MRIESVREDQRQVWVLTARGHREAKRLLEPKGIRVSVLRKQEYDPATGELLGTGYDDHAAAVTSTAAELHRTRLGHRLGFQTEIAHRLGNGYVQLADLVVRAPEAGVPVLLLETDRRTEDAHDLVARAEPTPRRGRRPRRRAGDRGRAGYLGNGAAAGTGPGAVPCVTRTARCAQICMSTRSVVERVTYAANAAAHQPVASRRRDRGAAQPSGIRPRPRATGRSWWAPPCSCASRRGGRWRSTTRSCHRSLTTEAWSGGRRGRRMGREHAGLPRSTPRLHDPVGRGGRCCAAVLVTPASRARWSRMKSAPTPLTQAVGAALRAC